MSKIYICTDDSHKWGNYGKGESLEKAYDNLKENTDTDPEEVKFFECDLIEVEFKIIKKEKPVKVKKDE